MRAAGFRRGQRVAGGRGASGCRVRAAATAAFSHVKGRSRPAEAPRCPALRGLPLRLPSGRRAAPLRSPPHRRSWEAPRRCPRERSPRSGRGEGWALRRPPVPGRPGPAGGGCAREEPPSPPSPSSPRRGGRGGRRDALTPGRAVPCHGGDDTLRGGCGAVAAGAARPAAAAARRAGAAGLARRR